MTTAIKPGRVDYSSFGLLDKIAVVTGASQGIGRAIALGLAQAGAHLVLAKFPEKRHDEITAVKAEIEALGRKAVIVQTDVAEVDQVRALMDKTKETFGRIDILGNDAGVMDLFASVADVDNETWRRVLSVNLDGPMFAMRRAVPLMLKQGSGSIVNVASVAGVGGGSAGAAYTASKHALIGLTKSTAFQYAKLGLRCNALAVGGVDTNIMQSIDASHIDQSALARLQSYHATNPGMLAPVDIANVVVFLASDEARHLNGAVIPVDMGWRSA